MTEKRTLQTTDARYLNSIPEMEHTKQSKLSITPQLTPFEERLFTPQQYEKYTPPVVSRETRIDNIQNTMHQLFIELNDGLIPQAKYDWFSDHFMDDLQDLGVPRNQLTETLEKKCLKKSVTIVQKII